MHTQFNSKEEDMGAFDSELYALGYRFPNTLYGINTEQQTNKEKPLPELSKHSLLELVRKHNISFRDVNQSSVIYRYLVCDRDGTVTITDFIPDRTKDGWDAWGYRYYIKLKKPSYDWDKVIITTKGYIKDTSLKDKGKIFGFYRNDHPDFIKDETIYLKENHYESGF